MSNFAFVQETTFSGSNSGAFGSNNTAGNCIVVIVYFGGSGVTDSQGNTYKLIQTNDLGNIWAATHIKAGANIVTSMPISGGLQAFEYSSANPTYSVCPGCSNFASSLSGAITNTVYTPGQPPSLFTASGDVLAIFVAWDYAIPGPFTLPGATFRFNTSIPQDGGTYAAYGEIDIPGGISGSYSAGPLRNSSSGNPTRSMGVFLNLGTSCGAAPPSLSISCGSPPTGIIGSPYNHLFPTTGGSGTLTYSISSGSLPPGLSLGISTGSVTGIPTAVGTYPFTVFVADSGSPQQTASVGCSIAISPGGNWVIQEVQGELIPTPGPIDGDGHFRYRVAAIDAAQAGTYLGFWADLGGSGGGDISSTGYATGGGSTTPSAPPGSPPAGALVVVAEGGTVAGTEPEINFIPGTNITISAVDNPTDTRVDVTINSSSGGGTVTNTSGALTLDQPVFGNGGDDIKVGTKSGNTDEVMSASGTFLSGDLLAVDVNGNAVDSSVSVASLGNYATKLGVQESTYTYAADTGTANAYAVSITPTPTLGAGSVLIIKVLHTNTGASTIATNGGFAIAVKKESGSGLVDLAVGDWQAGGIVVIIQDGSIWQWIGGGTGGGGSGTVTSVALTVPSWLTVSGSPITTSGTLAVTGTSESANLFLASPNGSSGAMTPRAIVPADLPVATTSALGVVEPDGTTITISAGVISAVGGGSANFADNETPSGALNGINQTYTLAHTPSPGGSLLLVYNGVIQLQGTDYTLSTATITFTNAKPNSSLNEWIRAWYRY